MSDLTTKLIEEEIPCGKAITTEYYDASGEVVRRDVRIEVSEGCMAQMLANLAEKEN